MSTNAAQDKAVREYLLVLRDPQYFIDPTVIVELEATVQALADFGTDPVAHVLAIAELERASKVDIEPYRQQFIRHIKKWATRNSVSVGALMAAGVESSTLHAAGMTVPFRQALSRTPSMNENNSDRPSCDGSHLEGFDEWGDPSCQRGASHLGLCFRCYQRRRYWLKRHGLPTKTAQSGWSRRHVIGGDSS